MRKKLARINITQTRNMKFKLKLTQKKGERTYLKRRNYEL